VLERGGSSAAPKCSNQTDLRLTLADLFYGSDLPGRPSPTFTDLVCIQGITGGPEDGQGDREAKRLRLPGVPRSSHAA
jgi:hypothetical protein